MYKGGRGKRAPYKCTTVRVPIPIKEQVFTIIMRYQSYLQSPDADPDSPPDFLTIDNLTSYNVIGDGDKLVTGITQVEQGVTGVSPHVQVEEEISQRELTRRLGVISRTARKWVNKPFPKLKKICLERGVDLIDVKEQWRDGRGVTRRFVVMKGV